MHNTSLLKCFLVSSLFSAFAFPAFAASNNCEALIKDVPGTYKLVKRTMPDGTVLSGPKVQGTTIFTKEGHRVTAVSINTSEDTFSAALQTEYSITGKEFSDTLSALVLQDGKSSAQYKFNQPKATAPVVCNTGTLVVENPPYDPLATLSFTKSGMTASLNKGPEAGAVDEWVRLK
jgi:hypothetical protein